jgi:SAM-dependent methyltransferase
MKNNSFKNYSLKQYNKIYGSTLKFIKFLEKYIDLNKKNLIDLACGGGANTIYLAKKYPQSSFLGIDYDRNLIKLGNKLKKNLSNIKFKIDNWNNVGPYKSFIGSNKKINSTGGGIICFQSLTCLDMQLEEILKNFKKKNFPFVAFSSLFYEGKCDYKIYVKDFSQASEFKEGWYNIYSTYTMKNILKKKGYKNFKFSKYNIQYNLPKPKHSGMQSYTIKNNSGKRIIFSGALHLPYAFFLAY